MSNHLIMKRMFLLNALTLLFAISKSPLMSQVNLGEDTHLSENSFSSKLEDKKAEIEKTIKEAQNAINDAYEYFQSGNFRHTEDILSDVESNLTKSMATENIFNQIQLLRAEILLKRAEEAYEKGNIQEAKGILNQYNALRKSENKKPSLPSRQLSKNLKNPYKQNLQEINPSYVRKLAKGEELVLEGQAQFINGDYLGAYQTFKTALLENPLNSTAKAFLTIIDEKLIKLGRKDYENTRSQLLRNVSDSWQLPRVFDRKTTENNTKIKANPIAKKIEQIIVEEVQYTGSRTLSQVVEDLSEISVLYDKTSTDGTAGVNIVLMDPSHDPTIRVTLRNSTLKEILDTITSIAQCDYELDDNIIKISKRGISNINTSSNLKTKMFPITRAAILEITGGVNSMQESSSPSPEEDIFATEPVSIVTDDSSSDEEMIIKAFLERAGVPFGDNGSSLALSGGTKLWITQTTRNLEKIQNILRSFDQTKQVRIHSRFLEVSDGDLNEFGFRWFASSGENNFAGTTNAEGSFGNLRTLGTITNLPSSSNGTVLLPSTQQTVATDGNGDIVTNSSGDPVILNTSNAGGTDAQRITIENPFPYLSNSINKGNDAFPMLGLLRKMGDWDLKTSLRALEQKAGSDLMSSPSVTVLSGKTANVSVGQEFRYPTSFSDAQASVNSGTNSGSSIAIVPGTPMDFETRMVGVEMSVTPTVENDNKINLQLSPQVTEFEGFVEHGGKIVGVGNGAQIIIPSGFLQPIFSTRKVDTEVTIFDGSIVVLGGLVRNEIKRVNDKVPFFGNLPIIGKAFQSKGETNQKRNLLIFVGANLVSPGGSTSKERFDTVEPNSLFQDPMIMTPGGSVARSLKD